MNPLASLISALVALKNDLYAKFNAALSKLPPLEQIEGGNAGMSAVRELDWAKDRIERVGEQLEATLTQAAQMIQGFERKAGEPVDTAAERLIATLEANAGSAALSAAIAGKTHLPIEDHQAALDNAVNAAKETLKTELETGFNARLDEIRLIAERRSAVIEKLGPQAAAAVSDADLLAEDHEARVQKVEDRVKLLAGAGITPADKPKNFASLMACGTDEQGETEFVSRLETIKEAAGGINLAAAAPKPSTPAGTLASGEGDSTGARKVII
jgi:hypothetical protein